MTGRMGEGWKHDTWLPTCARCSSLSPQVGMVEQVQPHTHGFFPVLSMSVSLAAGGAPSGWLVTWPSWTCFGSGFCSSS